MTPTTPNAIWTEFRTGLASKWPEAAVEKPGCLVVAAEARTALGSFPSDSVACVVTSPPYGSLKNYGPDGQIGFGQDYEAEYLPALEAIFKQLHRVCRTGAACWVVLDTVRQGGVTAPLPLEFITRAQAAGWTFHDLVIWDKGRTLPWSHAGRFRNVVEYVLLFAKGALSTFDLDAVRDAGHLGPYWVRYPERYHPDGKAPSDLWHFPIPVQGSWAKAEGFRHFCPFPVGLVGRMLALTTKPGDIVLDPFAGTSTVPAVAEHLGRFGIGIELNPDFVRTFGESGYDLLRARAATDLPANSPRGPKLRRAIIELRMQKYPKALFSELSRSDRLNGDARTSIAAFLLRRAVQSKGPNHQPLDTRHLGEIELDILASATADVAKLTVAVSQRVSVAPLSKFGLAATVNVVPHSEWTAPEYVQTLPRGAWYTYRRGGFQSFDERLTQGKLAAELITDAQNTKRKVPTIFSQLKLQITRLSDN